MKPRFFQLLEMAIENGIDYGWTQAHKHDGEPAEFEIKSKILDGVLNEICEWFHLEDEYADQ